MKRIVPLIALAALSVLLLPRHAQCQTTPVVVSSTVSCATSTDGSVVGVRNPLNPPIVAAAYSGTLPAGNYYIQIGWYDAAAHSTLVGPEVQTQLTSTGALQISLPASGKPAAAVGMNVYIGASSGAETLQGQTAGAATFTQSTPLASGTAVPTSNTTICAVVANDAGWPTGTGYDVSMVTPAGDVMPGYPMQWQLLGPGGTINLGQGLPLYDGTVTYPIPILSRPYNHAAQSISGPLNMTSYSITQVLKLGVGTSVPAWPVDVENGPINTKTGYIFNGGVGVTTGDCLVAGSDLFLTFVPGTCFSGSLKYQTIENAGTALPQEPNVNLIQGLTGVDNPGNQSTDVGLPNRITPGVYAQPLSMTLSAQGVVTAITPAAVTPVPRTCNANGCYRIDTDGTITEWGTLSLPANGSTYYTASIVLPYGAPASMTFDQPVVVGNFLTDWSPATPPCVSLTSTTLSGASVAMARCVVASAGGGFFDANFTLQWSAKGY